MAIKAINEVIIAWLFVEEVVANVQKALHLSKPGEAGAAFVIILVVGVKEVRVGAYLDRRQDISDGAHELLG
jgi:hypothetical protein